MAKSQLVVLGLCLLAIGCQPNITETPTEPATEPAAPAVSTAIAQPSASTVPESADPAPSLPAWATVMIGQPVTALFPNAIAECIGSADMIALRFATPQPTVRIDGWAWNVTKKTTFDRLVAVNDADMVIGAGTTLYERPDVLAGRAGVVTELLSGYQVYVPDAPGRVRIFGLDDSATAACNFVEIKL